LAANEAVNRVIWGQNNFLDPAVAEPGTEPGPKLTMGTGWPEREKPTPCPPRGPVTGACCEQFAIGQHTNLPTQLQILRSSPTVENWNQNFKKLVDTNLPIINNHRRIIFALYELLVSTKKAENLLLAVVHS
jgi:hypothetical protein